MKIKSLGTNITEVETKDLRILVSYSTPVACIRYTGTQFKDHNIAALKTEEFFSVTTSKHINQWLRDNGCEPSKVPTGSQEYFNQLLE